MISWSSLPRVKTRSPSTSKTALVAAAAAALFIAPEVPDTGDLREDLLACGRAYLQREGRSAQVLAAVLTASQHDPALRDASREALGAPYGGLFEQVLTRAVERGSVPAGVDIETLAEVFPAIAYQRVAARGLLIAEKDVVRVVDSVLLPALRARSGATFERRCGDATERPGPSGPGSVPSA